MYKEHIAKISVEGNKMLHTEVHKPGVNQQSVLRIPGVPLSQSKASFPAVAAEYQNYFDSSMKWPESNEGGHSAQVSYSENKGSGMNKVVSGSLRSSMPSQKVDHSWQKEFHYNSYSHYQNGQFSQRSTHIYSQSFAQEPPYHLSNHNHGNTVSSGDIYSPRETFCNQNYHRNSVLESQNRDKLSETYHRVKQSEQIGLQIDNYSMSIEEAVPIQKENNLQSDDHKIVHNQPLGTWNNVDDRQSEVDSVIDDSEFVGSDESQQEPDVRGSTLRQHSLDQASDTTGICNDHMISSAEMLCKRAELISNITENKVLEVQMKTGSATYQNNRDPTQTLQKSAALITDLLRCNSSLDITRLYRMDDLLQAEDGVTTTLCTLGDEIVNKLVQWTKQLPFYKEIPVEVHSNLLSCKWHELLLLITSAYNSLHRPRLKELRREEMYEQNMEKLKVNKCHTT